MLKPSPKDTTTRFINILTYVFLITKIVLNVLKIIHPLG